MIKTLTLFCLLGISILFTGSLFRGISNDAFNRASAAEARRVIEEYASAVLAGDQTRLETVLHTTAVKQEYVRFLPHASFGLYTYDRDKFAKAPRFSQSDWGSIEPQTEQIDILAATEMTATASLSGTWGTEYLHLLRVRGGWQIVHVLGIDPGAELSGEPAVKQATAGI